MRILCVHIETSSLWAEFVNKNRQCTFRTTQREYTAVQKMRTHLKSEIIFFAFITLLIRMCFMGMSVGGGEERKGILKLERMVVKK